MSSFNPGRLSGVCVAAGLLVAVSGCQNSRNESLAYVERPVEQLYNEAADALDQRTYQQAVLLFDEVERQHPYTEWASRSTLMSAFANYQSNRYEDAISAARRYIALHPGNEETAYAYYLIGISYFEQIVDVGRDQKTTELALEALTDVRRRYPQTEYALDASLKIDMVRDQLAGKEMEVGRWYLRRNQHLAAINRFKKVVKDFETTTHTPEALHRLTEAYMSIGLQNEALSTASVLGYNYPDSQWYADSYALMTDQGLELEVTTEDQTEGYMERLLTRVF